MDSQSDSENFVFLLNIVLYDYHLKNQQWTFGKRLCLKSIYKHLILTMLTSQLMHDHTTKSLVRGNRGFPKIDHSGIDARIVLEQNKFSKKATSNRT